jgi:hypothetical protein
MGRRYRGYNSRGCDFGLVGVIREFRCAVPLAITRAALLSWRSPMVRSITEDIDPKLLKLLGNRADGEIIKQGAYGF